MQIGNLTIKPGQLYIGLAVIMAVLCGLVMQGGLRSKPKASNPSLAAYKPEPTTPVVVATYPAHAGDVLKPDQLHIVDWPVKLLPVGHTFRDLTQLAGTALKADLYQGEPVFQEKLASTQSTGGLPVLIPPGLRAMTVAVSEVKGVAGFIKPGDFVDVLATFELTDNNQKDQLTKTVLQNILVVATAQDMVKNDLPKPEDVPTPEANSADPPAKGATPSVAASADPANKEKSKTANDKKTADADKPDDEKPTARLVASVTLALTPAQAERLTLAEDTGNIRLILRPDQAVNTVPPPGVRQSQLIGKSSPAPRTAPASTGRLLSLPPAPQRPRYQVEMIEGSERHAHYL
jgi:Flp pilus assembly protein CpaB